MRHLIHFVVLMACPTYAYATGFEIVATYLTYAALAYSVYAYLTAPDGPNIKQDGPRLNDLRIMTASPGVCIPRIRGSARVAGIVIDKSNIRETAITTAQDVGGKGPDAGSVSQTGYVYDVDLDVMVCRGPAIGIRRIWADQRLVYTIADTASIGSVAYSRSMAADVRIYLGDQLQGPDPTFEAVHGVGNVPGYRGRCHVVFESLMLAQFGNRIPSLTFEVVMDSPTPIGMASTLLLNTSAAGLTGGFCINRFGMSCVLDHDLGIMFYDLVTQTVVANLPFSGQVSLLTQTFQNVYGYVQITPDSSGGFWALMPGLINGSLGWALVRWNASAQAMSFYTLSGPSAPSGTPNAYQGIALAPTNEAYAYFIIQNALWRQTLISDPAASPVQSVSPVMVISSASVIVSVVADQYGHVWCIGITNPGLITGTLHQIAPDGSLYSVVFVANSSPEIHPKVVTDETYIYLSYASVVSTTRVIAKFNRSMVLVDTTVVPGTFTSFEAFDVDARGNYLAKVGTLWYSFAPVTGAVLYSVAAVAAPTRNEVLGMYNNVGYLAWFDSVTFRIYAVELTPRVALPAIDADKAKVGEFVQELLIEAGMTAGQLDTTQIDNIPMDGVIASRVGPARAMIDILRAAYFFDLVETDEKLRAILRGAASLVTIPHTDLIVGEDGREPLEVLRGQELDMPEKLTVKFMNFHNDYQDGSETASRIVTDAEGHAIVEVPLVLTPNQAAQIANVLIDEIMVGRNRITVPTYRKYSRYQPSDVITATTSGGSTLRLRVQDKREVGNRVIFGGVQDDAIVYNPNATGGSSTVGSTDVSIAGPTRLEFLDIPLIIDADASEGLYISLSGYTGSWPGAAVLRSPDGASFTNVGSVVTPSAVGRATTALPNFLGGNVVDELSIVTVVLTSGAIASCTYNQLLSGTNVAVIGNEIVYFRDATLIAANTYTLTGFLRGRRGTEFYTSALHAINDRFVLMGGSGITRPAMATTDINVVRHYKGVTFGATQASSPTATNTNTAAGLKPYSPVFTAGYREAGTNDWKIVWVRRGRLDNAWRDSVDVTLGETTESYSIDIYNAAGTLVLRTLTSTTQTLTYTSAQQVTDFGSSQAAIKVAIYQVSATVGRGFGTGIVQL